MLVWSCTVHPVEEQRTRARATSEQLLFASSQPPTLKLLSLILLYCGLLLHTQPSPCLATSLIILINNMSACAPVP